MPSDKISWLGLFLLIIIPVTILGPLIGYTVDDEISNSPLFVIQLMTFQIDNVPIALVAFFDFIAIMTGIIIIEIVSVASTAGAVVLAVFLVAVAAALLLVGL